MLYRNLDDEDNHRSMRANRKPGVLLTLVVLALAPIMMASDKPRPAPPVKPAAEYPDNDSHPQEKVTLAADPCDDTDDCKFFRLPYVSHGFVAVRVIITNDRDDALMLEEARMQFLPAEGDKEAAATVEDLNRRMFTNKSAMGTRIPIIGITTHPEPVDSKILNDDADFGFASTVVPAHSTRAGYVFYDTKQIEDPIMKHAELYVKEIYYNDERGKKHQLFAFQLPFDKWLATKHQPLPKPDDAAKKLDAKVPPPA